MFWKNFYLKFIGCIYKERVEVFVVSVNFINFYFGIKNYEFVVYYEMIKVEFLERFIEFFRLIIENDLLILI